MAQISRSNYGRNCKCIGTRRGSTQTVEVGRHSDELRLAQSVLIVPGAGIEPQSDRQGHWVHHAHPPWQNVQSGQIAAPRAAVGSYAIEPRQIWSGSGKFSMKFCPMPPMMVWSSFPESKQPLMPNWARHQLFTVYASCLRITADANSPPTRNILMLLTRKCTRTGKKLPNALVKSIAGWGRILNSVSSAEKSFMR